MSQLHGIEFSYWLWFLLGWEQELGLGEIPLEGRTAFEYYSDAVQAQDPLNPLRCAPYM